MLNVGYQEMFLIAAVALLVLGPKRLPEFFRQIGKFSGAVRRLADDFRTEVERAELRREGLDRIEPPSGGASSGEEKT